MRRTYDVKEVAEITGVHPATVYRAIANGIIRGVRVGRRRLVIPKNEIRKMLEADYSVRLGQTTSDYDD